MIFAAAQEAMLLYEYLIWILLLLFSFTIIAPYNQVLADPEKILPGIIVNPISDKWPTPRDVLIQF